MSPFKGFMGSKPEGGAAKDPSGKTFFDFSELDINADSIEFSSLKGKKGKAPVKASFKSKADKTDTAKLRNLVFGKDSETKNKTKKATTGSKKKSSAKKAKANSK